MKNQAFEAYVREARLQQSLAVGNFIADTVLAVGRAVKQGASRIVGRADTLSMRKPASRPNAT